MPLDFTPVFVSTREAAARLGYRSLDTFYDHVNAGWIAGAERHGNGRGRWRFRLSELAYIGPVERPVDDAARREAERLARLEAFRPEGGFVNPFLKSRKAVA